MKYWRQGVVILLTLVVAMVLSVAHWPADWPDWLHWLRPAWILLLVFFWTMMKPSRLGLFSVWLFGFGVDVLHSDPLGLNGAVFALAAFLASHSHRRLLIYTIVQQSVVVLGVVLICEAVRQIVRTVAEGHPFSAMFWTPALASALIWLLAWPIHESVRKRFAAP